MFVTAVLIGIYSYLILALGLIGVLYRQNIIILTIIYISVLIFLYRTYVIRSIYLVFERVKRVEKLIGNSSRLRSNNKNVNIFTLVFLGLIISQAFVNLIGSLGPELGFDALWYHLTIPKLYLESHSVFYIPGGLLYYSLMPKLTEMLYVGALALNGETLAKLIHFSFGLLSLIALYKLSRIFFIPKISLIAVVVFYSNLVVGWQSTTAYVDLARTFFEIMALCGFVNWWKKGEKKWLVESAVMLGLAVSTKLLALGSLIIFTVLLVYTLFFKNPPRRSHGFADAQPATVRGAAIIKLFVYWVICLLIPLPWFVFSFVNTGNPIYPFFTEIYKVGFDMELLNPIRFVRDVWGMFIKLSDPISPMYIIFLPLIVILFKKFKPDIKLIAIYSFLAIVVWYVTPRTGGGRFILPYLTIFSVLIAAIVEKTKDKIFRLILINVIIIVSFISIIYRGVANAKYIPAIFSLQSKSDFLEKHLNFSFGDFYDIDGYFKNNIKQEDTVLLYGFHNLYYVDFPFIDSSWVKKGDTFNFIASQNISLPKRFNDWDLVYQNPKTYVKLFSKGGIKWAY